MNPFMWMVEHFKKKARIKKGLALYEESVTRYPNLSFSGYLIHWGEEKFRENLSLRMACHKSQWERRETDLYLLRWYPCWELIPGCYWTEDWDSWLIRWGNCGGRVFETNRLIAAKWDPIWGRLSSSFSDGLGNPYPPYSRGSCAGWRSLSVHESIVLGVIEERELNQQFPPSTAEGVQLAREWKEHFDSLSASERDGLRSELGLDKTHEDLYAEEKQRELESRAEMALAYKEHCDERDIERKERDKAFLGMGEMDSIFKMPNRDNPSELLSKLNILTNSKVFDRYPKWRARGLRYTGELLEEYGQLEDALKYYEAALEWDVSQPVKRKIGKLRKRLQA
jgi:tetratricopeptide (TPR) repeat protein